MNWFIINCQKEKGCCLGKINTAMAIFKNQEQALEWGLVSEMK